MQRQPLSPSWPFHYDPDFVLLPDTSSCATLVQFAILRASLPPRGGRPFLRQTQARDISVAGTLRQACGWRECFLVLH